MKNKLTVTACKLTPNQTEPLDEEWNIEVVPGELAYYTKLAQIRVKNAFQLGMNDLLSTQIWMILHTLACSNYDCAKNQTGINLFIF